MLLFDFGRALTARGRPHDAIEPLQEALSLQRELYNPPHPVTIRIEVDLADAMRASGNYRQASRVLSEIGQDSIATLQPNRQARADLLRLEGLLLLGHRDFDGAIARLRGALAIVNHRLGHAHWRTEQAREELQAALRAKMLKP
jgi:tetratricopeptide (TPR) repeat protein